MAPVKISITLQSRLSGYHAPLVTPWHAFPTSITLEHAKHPIPRTSFPFIGQLQFFFLPLPGRAAISSCLKPTNLYENFMPISEGILWMIWQWAHFNKLFLSDHFSVTFFPVFHRYLFLGEPVCCVCFFFFLKLQGLHIDFSFIMKHGIGSV